MTKFNFNVNIEAQSSEEANKIMKALLTIKKTMQTDQLLRLERACEQKPGLIAQADGYLKLKGL